jgi:hypothetical protein
MVGRRMRVFKLDTRINLLSILKNKVIDRNKAFNIAQEK